MRVLSASFPRLVLRLLAIVMALALTVGPWAPLAQPAAAAGGADLTIESITINPSDPSADDMVTITVRVKNIGDQFAAACYMTAEVDGVVLASQTVSQLQPNMIATGVFNWTATPGQHVIRATADSTGIVFETNETNNVDTFTFEPRVADLTIAPFTWTPLVPVLRQEVRFTVHIENSGTARSKPTRVNFFVDGTSSGYQDVAAIEPGSYINIIYPWYAGPGQYLMKAVVDEDNTNVESNENNNERSLTFTMALPDLVVENIYQTPAEYSSGDTVTIRAVIRNQGTGPAEKSQAVYEINDVMLATVTTPALAVGASANVTTTWTAKDSENYVRVIADYYHVITESDELNNQATQALGTVPPDLTVSAITWTPTSIGAGDIVNIQVTIKNEGAGKALSSRGIYQIGLAGAQIYPIGPLAAGATTTLTIPWTAIAGTFDVSFTANYDNLIEETKYSNNRRSATISVTPPDLTISSINWTPEHPDHNTPVTFNVTVKNVGNGRALQSYLGYYIDDQLVFNTLVTNLSKNQSVVMQFTWTAASGYHTFKAVTDFKKSIAETNENNNELEVAIVANMPDLVIKSVTWSPPGLPVGQDIFFTLELHNMGTQPVPLTRLAYYVDGIMTGYVDVPPLAPDGKATEQLIWPLSTGQHRIEFVADATDLVEEIDEENNIKVLTLPLPDLVVTGLAPSTTSPVSGDTVTVTVTLRNDGSTATQAGLLSGRLDENNPKLQAVAPIAPGETATKVFEWVATGGSHTFYVAADFTNTTIESDETNNYRSVSINTQTPDLTVGQLGWYMENPLENNNVDLSAVITNAGDGTSPAATVQYRIDGGTPVSVDVPVLVAGETFELKVSTKLNPAPHTFAVTVDPETAILESDETNNAATLEFNSKAPDLNVRAITWTPASAVAGDNVTISVNVENRGTAAVDGWTVTLRVDGDDVATETAGEIGIGESRTISFPWTLGETQPVFTALADYGGQVAESDETNNELTTEATFTAPEPPAAKPIVKVDLGDTESAGFLQSSWWLIAGAAAVIGAGVFIVLLRAFRKE